MKYITLDILENGCLKHKDWICDAVCDSEFSYLIKYIVEKETDHFLENNQPERSKREDVLKECEEIGHMNMWMPKNQSLCMRCGALNTMET